MEGLSEKEWELYISNLLKQAKDFIENENWESAAGCCEKVLEQDANNSDAYLFKVLIQLHCVSEDQLPAAPVILEEIDDFMHAFEFASAERAKVLSGYAIRQRDRLEQEGTDTETDIDTDTETDIDTDEKSKLKETERKYRNFATDLSNLPECPDPDKIRSVIEQGNEIIQYKEVNELLLDLSEQVREYFISSFENVDNIQKSVEILKNFNTFLTIYPDLEDMKEPVASNLLAKFQEKADSFSQQELDSVRKALDILTTYTQDQTAVIKLLADVFKEEVVIEGEKEKQKDRTNRVILTLLAVFLTVTGVFLFYRTFLSGTGMQKPKTETEEAKQTDENILAEKNEAEQKRLAEEKARLEAEQIRLVEEMAMREAEKLRMAAEEARRKAEQKQFAEKKTKQESKEKIKQKQEANLSVAEKTMHDKEKSKLEKEQKQVAAEGKEAEQQHNTENQAQILPKQYVVRLPNGVKLKMVEVKAGTFTMSKWDGENEDNENEHIASLTRDFFIGKYEITQEQWEAVMGSNPSYRRGNNLPVENISWYDAVNFCKKLNELTNGTRPDGYHYSLPTETQWEFACRGGNQSRWYKYSGSNNIDGVAWHDSNGNGKTHTVGTKQANELGLHDMSGNVSEWCLDCYQNDNSNAAAEITAGKDTGSHVTRGGSWISSTSICRPTYRNNCPSKDRCLGFRLALVPEKYPNTKHGLNSDPCRNERWWKEKFSKPVLVPKSESGLSYNFWIRAVNRKDYLQYMHRFVEKFSSDDKKDYIAALNNEHKQNLKNMYFDLPQEPEIRTLLKKYPDIKQIPDTIFITVLRAKK